ncbi:hypothetical protein GCM10011506_23010 [Marivirga lumbricoides]|uniref:ATP-binding protein n=1 Tax=Marivirga lumbricoides TaxID=1046115 RepID=A0ABQ1MBN1_9BACT|nr:hypothetical protein GCM10011506_23010 [Marivirga lumbricoides]
MERTKEKTYPGYNPQTKFDHFDEEEKKIIAKFAGEWYVTNGGGIFNLGTTSEYKYFLIKPPDNYKELFNIELEIIVIFSNYSTFETRSLDAISFIEKRYQNLRLEKLCAVIISKDESIVGRINDLVKNDQESQLIVPFHFEELLDNPDSYLIRNRFKSHFYTRDLFAFESPLKKDLYFFGRNDLVHKLVNRHRSNENSAIFGLRKTGKTSIVFGIKRILDTINERFCFIDCQNPALHKRNWNKALWYVIDQLYEQNTLKYKKRREAEYTETDAPIYFEEALKHFKIISKSSSCLVVFDEIENITFGTAPTEHWTKELDFVFFWQTIRSTFQKHNKLFSYLIIGTNPMCLEKSSINGKDNPIFNQIYFEYVPNFDVPQTREMVRKLGRIMGLKFDETIFAKLTEDFGGHPFLIRHVCSIINKICSETRPIRVDRTIYNQAVKKFNLENAHYIDMILNVLKEYYQSEFDMLKYIALDDLDTFNELAELSPEFTNHLIGYKILDKINGSYSFRIEAVKDYLLNRHKYEKALDSSEDRRKEISERRNRIELKLRKIVRTQLLAVKGKSEATQIFLSVLGDPRKTSYQGLKYADLFDSNKSEIYFEDIRKIIIKYYEIFKNIFGSDKDDFNNKMTIINKYRSDAHAKKVTREEMEVFRISISYIEDKISDFLE